MKVEIKESLYVQLEKLAEKNFRTPKLQLDFILSNIFATGMFSEQTIPTNPIQIMVKGSGFNSFEQIGTMPLTENEKSNLDIELEQIASLTKNVVLDEEDNRSWSNAREAFEKANMKAVSSMPRLTSEQEEEMRKGHEERKKSRGKINIPELIVDVIKDNM